MNILSAIADGVMKLTDWLFSWFGSDPRVEEIRKRVAKTCDFLPTVASVAAMLAASNPAVTGVVGIATAICQAVTASRSKSSLLAAIGDALHIGTVNGVPIEGTDLKGGK